MTKPPTILASTRTMPCHASNLFGQDYALDADRLGTMPFPIIDAHSHLSGSRAAAVYARVADAFGIRRVYSMTPLKELDAVSDVLGDRVRFIALPDIFARDRWHALTTGYAERLNAYYEKGVRIAKFWSAPRGIDFAEQAGAPANAFRLDAPHVQKNMEIAVELGMSIMVHISDPDTWFASNYADTKRYGTKADQYGPLEMCLQRFSVPFIAAHMGGWPEDLDFLDDLLSRYSHLHLDTSAAKWMVRELSRHPRDAMVRFFTRWQHRILFGSDIVTRDAHLSGDARDPEDGKSANQSQAFDLYASRYWALRTVFETEFDGPSPIADPDLHLVDPQNFSESDSPRMKGFRFPTELLRAIYFETPQQVFGETIE